MEFTIKLWIGLATSLVIVKGYISREVTENGMMPTTFHRKIRQADDPEISSQLHLYNRSFLRDISHGKGRATPVNTSFILDLPYPSHFLYSLQVLNVSFPFLVNVSVPEDPPTPEFNLTEVLGKTELFKNNISSKFLETPSIPPRFFQSQFPGDSSTSGSHPSTIVDPRPKDFRRRRVINTKRHFRIPGQRPRRFVRSVGFLDNNRNFRHYRRNGSALNNNTVDFTRRMGSQSNATFEFGRGRTSFQNRRLKEYFPRRPSSTTPLPTSTGRPILPKPAYKQGMRRGIIYKKGERIYPNGTNDSKEEVKVYNVIPKISIANAKSHQQEDNHRAQDHFEKHINGRQENRNTPIRGSESLVDVSQRPTVDSIPPTTYKPDTTTPNSIVQTFSTPDRIARSKENKGPVSRITTPNKDLVTIETAQHFERTTPHQPLVVSRGYSGHRSQSPLVESRFSFQDYSRFTSTKLERPSLPDPTAPSENSTVIRDGHVQQPKLSDFAPPAFRVLAPIPNSSRWRYTSTLEPKLQDRLQAPPPRDTWTSNQQTLESDLTKVTFPFPKTSTKEPSSFQRNLQHAPWNNPNSSTVEPIPIISAISKTIKQPEVKTELLPESDSVKENNNRPFSLLDFGGNSNRPNTEFSTSQSHHAGGFQHLGTNYSSNKFSSEQVTSLGWKYPSNVHLNFSAIKLSIDPLLKGPTDNPNPIHESNLFSSSSISVPEQTKLDQTQLQKPETTKYGTHSSITTTASLGTSTITTTPFSIQLPSIFLSNLTFPNFELSFGSGNSSGIKASNLPPPLPIEELIKKFTGADPITLPPELEATLELSTKGQHAATNTSNQIPLNSLAHSLLPSFQSNLNLAQPIDITSDKPTTSQPIPLPLGKQTSTTRQTISTDLDLPSLDDLEHELKKLLEISSSIPPISNSQIQSSAQSPTSARSVSDKILEKRIIEEPTETGSSSPSISTSQSPPTQQPAKTNRTDNLHSLLASLPNFPYFSFPRTTSIPDVTTSTETTATTTQFFLKPSSREEVLTNQSTTSTLAPSILPLTQLSSFFTHNHELQTSSSSPSSVEKELTSALSPTTTVTPPLKNETIGTIVQRGPLDVSSLDSFSLVGAPIGGLVGVGAESVSLPGQQFQLQQLTLPHGNSLARIGNAGLSYQQQFGGGSNPYLVSSASFGSPGAVSPGGLQFNFGDSETTLLQSPNGPPVGGYNAIAQGLSLLSTFGGGATAGRSQFVQTEQQGFDPSFTLSTHAQPPLHDFNAAGQASAPIQSAILVPQQGFLRQGFPQQFVNQDPNGPQLSLLLQQQPQSFSVLSENNAATLIQSPRGQFLQQPATISNIAAIGINPTQFGTLLNGAQLLDSAKTVPSSGLSQVPVVPLLSGIQGSSSVASNTGAGTAITLVNHGSAAESPKSSSTLTGATAPLPGTGSDTTGTDSQKSGSQLVEIKLDAPKAQDNLDPSASASFIPIGLESGGPLKSNKPYQIFKGLRSGYYG